jgi:hypothetical protein
MSEFQIMQDSARHLAETLTHIEQRLDRLERMMVLIAEEPGAAQRESSALAADLQEIRLELGIDPSRPAGVQLLRSEP